MASFGRVFSTRMGRPVVRKFARGTALAAAVGVSGAVAASAWFRAPAFAEDGQALEGKVPSSQDDDRIITE
jgi:hypothetical protein